MNNIFIETFCKVKDYRINRTKKHILIDVIVYRDNLRGLKRITPNKMINNKMSCLKP